MKVFISGATGVLGRRLVPELADRDHEVIGLVRDPGETDLVRNKGGTPHQGDVLKPGTLTEPLAECDAVVHAATAIPSKDKPTREDWERNDRVRRDGMNNLLKVADLEQVRRILFPSIVWVARRDDGSEFDESSPPNPDRVTRSALETERLLEQTAREQNLEHVILRCGMFYAHDADHTLQMGEKLTEGKLPIVGGGLLGRRNATLSFLHVDDAASAFVAAIEGPGTGTFHVVDDRPVTLAEFLNTFADKLDAPEPSRVPGWLARWFIGPDSVRTLTSSMPTRNDKFRETFDWEPAYPTIEEGLQQVVEHVRARR